MLWSPLSFRLGTSSSIFPAKPHHFTTVLAKELTKRMPDVKCVKVSRMMTKLFFLLFFRLKEKNYSAMLHTRFWWMSQFPFCSPDSSYIIFQLTCINGYVHKMHDLTLPAPKILHIYVQLLNTWAQCLAAHPLQYWRLALKKQRPSVLQRCFKT